MSGFFNMFGVVFFVKMYFWLMGIIGINRFMLVGMKLEYIWLKCWNYGI